MSVLFDRDMHKRYLSLLLIGIVKSLREKIAFKGGTCAAFFFNLPRFSFDLDFDIREPLNTDDISQLKEFVTKEGRVKEYYDKNFTTFFLFDYGKGYPNIKIELNKRVWKNNTYKSVWYLGVGLQVADETTIVTNKIVALTNRRIALARDLYDSWYFLKMGYLLNEALIHERTGKDLVSYLKMAVSFIKKQYTPRNILQGLGETLDEKQKIWAKSHLINEAIREIEKIIA
jgi:predicted nucleotidyltransferase component of viral defense system